MLEIRETEVLENRERAAPVEVASHAEPEEVAKEEPRPIRRAEPEATPSSGQTDDTPTSPTIEILHRLDVEVAAPRGMSKLPRSGPVAEKIAERLEVDGADVVVATVKKWADRQAKNPRHRDNPAAIRWQWLIGQYGEKGDLEAAAAEVKKRHQMAAREEHDRRQRRRWQAALLFGYRSGGERGVEAISLALDEESDDRQRKLGMVDEAAELAKRPPEAVESELREREGELERLLQRGYEILSAEEAAKEFRREAQIAAGVDSWGGLIVWAKTQGIDLHGDDYDAILERIREAASGVREPVAV